MAKTITYPDSGGSYMRKDGGKLDLVQATEQLPPVPESSAPDTGTRDQPAAAPGAKPAPLKSTQES